MLFRATRQPSRLQTGKQTGEMLKVLVVDDERDLRLILAEVLGFLGGYDVHTAGDAKTALELVDQQDKPFDGVFLDIQMPGMSGTQLCAVLRATPGYADVPILMLTAMTDREHLQKAFIAGANDLIAKPFEFDDLKARFAGERTNRFWRDGLKEYGADRSGPPGAAPREVVRSLNDAIALPGVPRCIKTEAFEIYLRHSAARYSSPLWIRAIKIGRVYDLFTRLPEPEFQRLLRDVARAFSRQTEASEDIFTYAGNGVFLSSCVGKSPLGNQSFVEALQQQPAITALESHDMRLAVFLGVQVPVEGRVDSDVPALINQAIDSAERAENNHSGWGAYREWLMRRNAVETEPPSPEKAQYQSILKDFIRKGQLGWRK